MAMAGRFWRCFWNRSCFGQTFFYLTAWLNSSVLIWKMFWAEFEEDVMSTRTCYSMLINVLRPAWWWFRQFSGSAGVHKYLFHVSMAEAHRCWKMSHQLQIKERSDQAPKEFWERHYSGQVVILFTSLAHLRQWPFYHEKRWKSDQVLTWLREV
jgi:hypothetical protein